MQDELGIDLRGKHVLMVSALDRFGMAQALVDAGADVLFGDFIFALDKDMPVRDLHEFEQLAEKYLPDACKLPFQFFYPTGKKQEKPPEPKYPHYYDEAEIIAGDFHFMRQFMPERLDGKIVLTNTVTQANVEELARARRIRMLITTTPDLAGRSFGTNVLEAALLALLGKRGARSCRPTTSACCTSCSCGPASLRRIRAWVYSRGRRPGCEEAFEAAP